MKGRTYVGNNPLIYTDPNGHYKDSDNSELRRILDYLTQTYNVAKNAGDNQAEAVIDAEKMADAHSRNRWEIYLRYRR